MLLSLATGQHGESKPDLLQEGHKYLTMSFFKGQEIV